jgi:hypothetical protein
VIDVDLLKRENIIGIIDEFEREEMAFSGSGVLPVQSGPGQLFGWDIMALRRDIAGLQGRHSQAQPRQLTAIGHQDVTLARSFLSRGLPGSVFMDLRDPGSDSRQSAAEDTVARELREMDSDIARVNEFLIAGALQGTIVTTIDGLPLSIDYQIPAATNVFTIGGAPAVNIPVTWEDPSADIVDDLRRMKRAIQRGSGRPAKQAWASSRTIAAMTKNDTVKDFFRGTANASQVLREGTLGRFMGLDWREVDTVFEDNVGALQEFLPEERIIVTPAPSADWGFMREGSDIVPADDRQSMEEVVGRYGYSNLEVNPALLQLFMGEIRLPVIRIPAALVIANIIP